MWLRLASFSGSGRKHYHRFLGDNGYGLGEHGQWMKQTVFEYAAGIPFMMFGAGVEARRKACNRTVEFLDIYLVLADRCEGKTVMGYSLRTERYRYTITQKIRAN